jgi:hypothetical protein
MAQSGSKKHFQQQNPCNIIQFVSGVTNHSKNAKTPIGVWKQEEPKNFKLLPHLLKIYLHRTYSENLLELYIAGSRRRFCFSFTLLRVHNSLFIRIILGYPESS